MGKFDWRSDHRSLHEASWKGSAQKDELIQRFSLDPKKKQKLFKRKSPKVGLIAALAVDSDLYLFDEPTSGLDPLMETIFQEEVEN